MWTALMEATVTDELNTEIVPENIFGEKHLTMTNIVIDTVVLNNVC